MPPCAPPLPTVSPGAEITEEEFVVKTYAGTDQNVCNLKHIAAGILLNAYPTAVLSGRATDYGVCSARLRRETLHARRGRQKLRAVLTQCAQSQR
jgi:hypothetical protein